MRRCQITTRQQQWRTAQPSAAGGRRSLREEAEKGQRSRGAEGTEGGGGSGDLPERRAARSIGRRRRVLLPLLRRLIGELSGVGEADLCRRRERAAICGGVVGYGDRRRLLGG
ncbi:hypothetical protein E2562_011386 [Oryza meyeriana var. granulata]|uniref:Uncharacterized protein n=1 Tax=Oryza meyeriana var. granulata TaxID=110450 RepID=A0A6G1EA22_9ORYZ|nr:hypothetical protein E2562_011386 [Oryza meyeriana var. granulata]